MTKSVLGEGITTEGGGGGGVEDFERGSRGFEGGYKRGSVVAK